MSLGNIIGGILKQQMSGRSSSRLQTGAQKADQGGGIEQLLGSFLGNRGGAPGQGGSGGLADMAKDYLSKKQGSGMGGAKIGGLGALAGGLLGGGLGGAAKGGAMAVLGTLALKAWQDHQGQQPTPTPEVVDALTGTQTERLVLQAMIGAAQADGHIDGHEMEKILGQMSPMDTTDEERQLVRSQVAHPVDLARLGSEVRRPEVATEIYLAALVATEVDTLAEQDYLRRLAATLKLDQAMIERLHKLTGAPAPGGIHKPFAE